MFPRFISRQDRRERKRQLLNTSVRVITKNGSMDALGINISEDGMGVFTVAHLEIGSQVEVEFRTAEAGASLTRIAGAVRYRALYLYGIEFERGQCGEARSVELNTKNSETASLRS
jgi:hypothetical protein